MPRSRTAHRALLARRRREALSAAKTKPPATRRQSRAAASWPSKITVAELDELAAKHGVTFEEGATKADKQAALERAGIGPED